MEGADERRPVPLKVRRSSIAKGQSSGLKQNRECKPNTLRSLGEICACAAWVEEMLLHAGTVMAAKTSKMSTIVSMYYYFPRNQPYDITSDQSITLGQHSVSVNHVL